MFDKDAPPAWFERLRAACEAAKKAKGSYAGLSIAAGQRPEYVSEMLRKNVDPSVSVFIELVRALDTSVYKILYDIDITPEQEAVISLLGRLDREAQAELEGIVLRFARAIERTRPSS